METENAAPLADLPLDQLEGEIARRRQEQYPRDVEGLVGLIKACAARHKLTPRKVLEDCAKRLQKKKFVAIEDIKAASPGGAA